MQSARVIGISSGATRRGMAIAGAKAGDPPLLAGVAPCGIPRLGSPGGGRGARLKDAVAEAGVAQVWGAGRGGRRAGI